MSKPRERNEARPLDLARDTAFESAQAIACASEIPAQSRGHVDLSAVSTVVARAGSSKDAQRMLCNACVGFAGAADALLMPLKHDEGHQGAIGSDGLDPTDLYAISAVFGDHLRALELGTPTSLGPDFIPGIGPGHLLAINFATDSNVMVSLVLVKTGETGFASGSADILRALSQEVASGLRQARVDEEIRHRATERALISRITQTVVAMPGLDIVFAEVASAVRTLADWDACTVAVVARDIDGLTIEAVKTSDGNQSSFAQIGERIRLSDWQSLRFALENCSPYRLNLQNDVTLHPFERDFMAERGISTMLAVPFVVMGESIGLIVLTSATARSLDCKILRTIEEIGVNAALAVQHNQYREQAKQQAEEQNALLRVSQAVISGKDLHVILAEIGRVCLGFDGVEACRVLLWQKEQDQFEIAAIQNVRDWQMFYHAGDRYPAADWPTSRAVMVSKAARGMLVSDQELTARERANHIADQIESFYSFPIMIGDSAAGVLSLLSRQRRRLSNGTIRMGHELAAQAAHAIDRAFLFGQLQRRAETDGLTGLLNHRAAFETLDRELAAARKLGEPLSIIVVDLDDFKFFNDTHGHLTGDKVLAEVAAALKDTCRSRDYVARHGGDEFLIILPGTSLDICSQIAERLLRRMDNAAVAVAELNLPIRISLGLASFPTDATNRQELIAYADAAMYSAKELGGGQLGTIEKGTRSLEVTVFGALSGLVRAVDRKDRYTKDHSDIVAEYAVRFGKFLSLPAHHIEALDIAGQLHDVGKIAVPDSVLRKPGRLDPDEELLIRQHVIFSELIIKGVSHLDEVQEAVANHHERWDGTGYPYQKRGEEIPLMGRIMALADALAAMTHDRPYRKARSVEEAVIEIRRGSGTQFDPALVEDFIDSVSTGTAILRDHHRRRKFNPHNVDPDNPPEVVGLTDYLRHRMELRDLEDEQRNTA